MANIANDLSSVSGNLKKQYAPKIVNTVPTQALFQQFDPEIEGRKDVPLKIKWADVARLGDSFQYPTKVQSGQGVSYNGSDGGVRTLEDALNLKVIQASIVGYEMVNRQQMSYSAAYAGDEAGKKALETNAKLMLEDLKDVLYARNEMGCINGQNTTTGYGVVESQTLSGTTLTVVFTSASFSPGWWVGQQGARVEFFDGTTFVPATYQGDSYATVSTVNIATRTVVFTTTGSGFSNGTVPAAGNICFMKGALTSGGTFNEQIGLYRQLTDTSSTLFGINRSLYSLLQGQTYSAGSARLTKAKVLAAAMLPVNKGNMKDMVLVVGTNTWADLAAEDMSARIFDSSYNPNVSKSGSRSLQYESINGNIRVVCHPYMQAGVAMLFSEDDVSWIGSTDVTFKLPTGEDLFRLVDGKNAYESQCVSNKQIYHEAPGRAVVITGIVNSN